MRSTTSRPRTGALARRRALGTWLVAALGGALVVRAAPARATDRPLRVILPVGAGSGVDTIVRAVGPSLTKALDGQSIVIENLPGAGGTTGTLQLVKAAPDGQTIAFVSNNHAVNPSVFKKMPFDALADITPICVVGATPFLLVVNPAKLPVANAKELAAKLKAKPEDYNYASSGNGTIIHLAGEMFVEATGAPIRHIPYKGVGPMVADLIGGQVDLGVVALPAAIGHLKSGALRAIGVMGTSRVASLPNLPTLAEQGFPEVDIAGWFAVIGPPKLPPAEVGRLHAATVAAFAMPEAKEAMAKQENTIAPMSPEASTAFFRTEQERYARLVKRANITLE